MGRKAISGEPKTDRPLRIRLTDLERATLDRAAEIAGDKGTSTWARDLLIAEAGRVLAEARGPAGSKPPKKPKGGK